MDDHRRIPRRFYFLALTFVLIILFTVYEYTELGVRAQRHVASVFQEFRPDPRIKYLFGLPNSFELSSEPGRTRTPEAGYELERLQEESAILSLYPRPECPLLREHLDRYAQLHHRNANSSIFLALNLYENGNVMDNFMHELPTLLEFLGPHRVYVSIFENGSVDRTPSFLRLLARALDALGTSYTIIANGATDIPLRNRGHRIANLVRVRNVVMQPLYDGKIAQQMPGARFETALFMNDVVHCAADVLEVLLQKERQDADIACSLDWDSSVVYDRWIMRTMSGNLWYERNDIIDWLSLTRTRHRDSPESLPFDHAERLRFDALLPLQVFSCWNGMAAMRADAFLPPNNIRFRMARNDEKEGQITDKHSECYLINVDFWKAGFNRILTAPRSSVAYKMKQYERSRQNLNVTSLPSEEDERIEWITDPPPMMVFNDYGEWRRPWRVGVWDDNGA